MTASFISKFSKSMTLIRVSNFSEEGFNPMDQYKMHNNPSCIFAMKKLHVDLMETLALILPLSISTRAEDFIGDHNEAAQLQSSSTTPHNFTNLKTLLQVHFFDCTMKPRFNQKSIRKHVDNTQLHSMVQDMLPLFQIISINLIAKI
jgi:hypothetical protein